jgi:hypothetical protein
MLSYAATVLQCHGILSKPPTLRRTKPAACEPKDAPRRSHEPWMAFAHESGRLSTAVSGSHRLFRKRTTRLDRAIA